jgi:hypothetical protein
MLNPLYYILKSFLKNRIKISHNNIKASLMPKMARIIIETVNIFTLLSRIK